MGEAKRDAGVAEAGSSQTAGRFRARVRGLIAAVSLAVVACSSPASAQGGAPASAPEPLDPRAAKARLVLETHCARCHQRGMLRSPAPAAGLGDILDLDRIAADPGLVVPGNADASLLYTLILRREMPSDVAWDTAKEQVPVSADMDALRDWIEALPPPAKTCGTRMRVTPEAVMSAIRVAVARETGDRAGLRFVSLTHLHNLCASERAMSSYRQAVAKLLNGWSSAASPARLEAIGEAGAVLRVRLSDFGWTAAQWDKLTAGNPLATVPAVGPSDGVMRALGTPHPIVPGDWLAWNAMQPRIYADVAGLPVRLDDQLRALGIDRTKPDTSSPPARIGLRTSAITRGHRLIEYRPRPAGGVWLAYDFAGSDGRRDIFANPLGPLSGAGEGQPFKPDATRLMFSLPNGFPAYAVYDADGQRIEAVPVEIEPAASQKRKGAAAPSACMSCHDAGPRRAFDELREAAISTASPLPKAVREAVQALHPPAPEMQHVFATEGQRTRAALIAAGIDPDLTIDGIEIVAALAKAWTRPVTLPRAAEDLGLVPGQLQQLVELADDETKLIAARLASGAIPRAEAVRLHAALVGPPRTPEPSAGKALAAPSESILDLALTADKARYTVGEIATFTVRSSFDCNLTLISVNPAGKATVVFPNDFEQDNALAAGRVLRVPAEASPYRLRLTQAGAERMIGVCMAQSKMPDGIQQNYEQQRFTALGDWRNFLRAVIDDDTPEKSARSKSSAKPKPEAPRRIKLELQARTAIDMRVEDKR